MELLKIELHTLTHTLTHVCCVAFLCIPHRLKVTGLTGCNDLSLGHRPRWATLSSRALMKGFILLIAQMNLLSECAGSNYIRGAFETKRPQRAAGIGSSGLVPTEHRRPRCSPSHRRVAGVRSKRTGAVIRLQAAGRRDSRLIPEQTGSLPFPWGIYLEATISY